MIYYNGNFVAKEHLSIPHDDRGLRLGDGLFETMRCYNGKVYQLETHLNRLSKGMQAINLNYSIDKIRLGIEGLIKENALSSEIIRLTITRGAGGTGYLPDPQATPNLIMYSSPLHVNKLAPLVLGVSSWRLIPPACLPTEYKLTQGENRVLARMDAQNKQFNDALMLSTEGHIGEATSANIFWIKNSTLYTPKLSTGALNGTTRQAILRLSPFVIEEVEAPLTELQQAECVFISNISYGPQAVKSIEGIDSNWQIEHPILIKLQNLYQQDIHEQTS